MKFTLNKRAKGILVSALVVGFGMVGIAGGGKTLSALKHWFTSLIDRNG